MSMMFFITSEKTSLTSGADGRLSRQRRLSEPRAGSGVVRIDPLRFLAGCRTYKATKPGLVSVLYLIMNYNGIVVY